MTRTRWTAIALTLGLTLGFPQAAHADTLELSRGFDRVTRQGTSGGTENSGDCGTIATTPNHEITLTQDFAYLSLNVSGGGDPTLLVVGDDTGDRFCARSNPQQSGYWQQGTYRVYVGDLNGGSQPYTLSVSENP